MYTIIEKKFIRFEGDKSVYRADIGVDTAEDLPPAVSGNTIFAPFSMALVADTKEMRVLNSQGEWV